MFTLCISTYPIVNLSTFLMSVSLFLSLVYLSSVYMFGCILFCSTSVHLHFFCLLNQLLTVYLPYFCQTTFLKSIGLFAYIYSVYSPFFFYCIPRYILSLSISILVFFYTLVICLRVYLTELSTVISLLSAYLIFLCKYVYLLTILSVSGYFSSICLLSFCLPILFLTVCLSTYTLLQTVNLSLSAFRHIFLPVVFLPPVYVPFF